jgi:hypothetical protein
MPVSANNRSKLTNGVLRHARGTADSRSIEGRRWRDFYVGYRERLGREPDMVDDSLLRAAASLSLRGDQLAAEMASGAKVDPADLTGLASELRRILIKLGIDGNGRAEPEGPSLEQLLAEHRT